MRTLTLLFALLAATPALALDPPAGEPYRWRVVVAFDPHPLVTPGYRKQVVRELSAALGSLLDVAGTVTVVQTADAPADEVAQLVKSDGFAAFQDARLRKLTPFKTHYVEVRVPGPGAVECACRGHDGPTGLSTPEVRRVTVPDFASVGRALGLLVGRELGPVGTVTPPDPGADRVELRLQAGDLPGADRLVRRGDVFALAVVRESRGETFGQLRDYTLLRAEADARSGRVPCRVLTRYATPFRTGPSVLGFRCLKLATTTEPLAVRLVNRRGEPTRPGELVQVRASDVDFLPRTDGRDRLTLKDQVYRSQRPFRGVACVVVSVGAVGEEQFPVPMTGSGVVRLPFEADPETQKRARVESAREDLRQHLTEVRDALRALTADLARQIDAGKNEEALARGRDGLAVLSAQDEPLEAELKAFAALAGADHPEAVAATETIARMKADRAQVAARVDQLRVAVEKKLDPGRFEKEFRTKDLAARVRLSLERGEVPEALELYDQLIQITDDNRTRELRAKLAADYQPRSDAHQAARDQAREALAGATTLPAFRAGFARLKTAVPVLVEANDRHGLRAVAAAIEASYSRLKDVVDRATPGEVAEIQSLSEALRAMQLESQGKARAIEAGATP